MRTASIAFIFLNSMLWSCYGASNTVKIGAIFHTGSEEEEKVFKYAIEQVTLNRVPGQFVLEPIIKRVNFDTDSIGTAEAACELLAEGVAAIFGPKSPYTRPIVSSIAARHDIPHIEYSWRPIEESVLQSTTINVYPASRDIAKAIAVLTKGMPWSAFTAIYKTNDGLSRLQEALKLHGPEDNPVAVHQLGKGNDHRPLLKEIAVARETNVILDAETDNVIEILNQAREVGLMKDYHTWIISDLDFPGQSILNTFMNSTVNITGFEILTEKKIELQTALGIQSVKLESALIYDAVVLFDLALETLNLANAVVKSPLKLMPVPIKCETEEKYSAGKNLIDAMRSETRINEMTGPMDFDESGQRQTFEMQVTEFHLDTLITIGLLTKDELTLVRSDKQREQDMAKKIKTTFYRVTTRLGAPYLMQVTDNSTRGTLIGDKRYEGYSVDLIDKVSKVLNFSYQFELVPDGNYGSYNEVNKSWDGLVKRLQDHDADLAICDLTINHQREQAVDFTMPFMNLGISILYLKPEVKEQDLFSFLKPFSTDVWIYVAGAYISMSMLLFLLARAAPGEWDNPNPCNQNPEELENSFTLMNSMWLTIGSLMQQGSDILPRAPSIRMVAGMWWFFTMIMVQSYTANLAAFLTTDKLGDTISSAEELAAQTKIKYGVVGGGSTSMFFKDSNNTVYQRMWASMQEARPSVFTKTNDEGLERVRSGKRTYAFIMESTAIEYNVERHCELAQIGTLLDSKGYGIAMPPNSAYRTAISRAVLKLQENGTLEKLKKKWWEEMYIDKPCKKDEANKDSTDLELRLANVGGMFLVLGCGCVVAFVVVILEFLWNVRKVAVEEKITQREALIAELKFAVNIWAGTKPVKVYGSGNSSNGQDRGFGRAASVARSMVGSFLRLDVIDKMKKDNTSNTRSPRRGSD